MASVAERNARLDALVAATNSWAQKRQDEITQRVATSKKILRGRTGSERLAQSSVQASADVVATEIDDFLLA
jgi:hypothetical protein